MGILHKLRHSGVTLEKLKMTHIFDFCRRWFWWSLCTLYSSHAMWSYRRWLGSLLLWACVQCHVWRQLFGAITSHGLLILENGCSIRYVPSRTLRSSSDTLLYKVYQEQNCLLLESVTSRTPVQRPGIVFPRHCARQHHPTSNATVKHSCLSTDSLLNSPTSTCVSCSSYVFVHCFCGCYPPLPLPSSTLPPSTRVVSRYWLLGSGAL